MNQNDQPKPPAGILTGAAAAVQRGIVALNAYAGLMNVILGMIGAGFLVNEWQNRQADSQIKAIEALSGSASQSRAAIVYLAGIGANLDHQNLDGVNASGLRIEGAQMADVRMDNAELINTTLAGDLSALSLRCADISNLSLTNIRSERSIDARAARRDTAEVGTKNWNSPVLYTSKDALEKLAKSIGRDLNGELAAAGFLGGRPGAQAEQSLPTCLYDRLKKQGVTHEDLCRGAKWDGNGC